MTALRNTPYDRLDAPASLAETHRRAKERTARLSSGAPSPAEREAERISGLIAHIAALRAEVEVEKAQGAAWRRRAEQAEARIACLDDVDRSVAAAEAEALRWQERAARAEAEISRQADFASAVAEKVAERLGEALSAGPIEDVRVVEAAPLPGPFLDAAPAVLPPAPEDAAPESSPEPAPARAEGGRSTFLWDPAWGKPPRARR